MPVNQYRYDPIPTQRFGLTSHVLCVLVASAALLALAVMPSGRAVAQTGCGLPASGHIAADANITLTADCAQTGRLVIGTEGSTDKITVSIDGDGNTITGVDEEATLTVHSNVAFSLSNVTLSGGGRLGGGAFEMPNSAQAATISNVTFTDTRHSAIHFDNSSGAVVTHSLSSILIKDVIIVPDAGYYQHDHGIPAGIHTIGSVSLNINRIVFRNIRTGNAAIGANDNYLVPPTSVTKGTITFTGCLTADGVLPRVYYGTIVGGDIGACTGAIGNGGTSAAQYTQKTNAACGLPDGGWVYGSQTFTLSGTCTLSETLLITGDASVVIDGGKRNIIDLNGLTVGIRSWGALTLRNVVITGGGLAPLLTYHAHVVRISDSTFRDNAGPVIFQDSLATLERVTFERHTIDRDWPSAVFVNLSTRLTIRDSVFRGNSGGLGAIYAGVPFQYGPTAQTRLVGTNTFENNLPRDIHDPNGLLLTISRADPGQDEGESASQSPSDGATPVPQPRVPTGESLMATTGIEVSAPFGLGSGIQFQRRDASGIGIQSVIDSGFLDVVDIWGYAEQGWEVCFPQVGELIFLDAANSPRAPEPIAAYSDAAGMTCATGQRAGMLVLVPGPAAPPAASADPADPAPTTQASPLYDCMVTTTAVVNFRESPGGKRVADFIDPRGDIIAGWLPRSVTLTAFEREGGWFKVDYHGIQGWISADWASSAGACG